MTADKQRKKAARELAAAENIAYTAALRRLSTPTAEQSEPVLNVHPAAQPTVTCPACEAALLTLVEVEVEAVPVVQWRYGCTGCGTEVLGARCGMPGTPCAFHQLPSHAYLTVMPWQAGQGPARERHERELTAEQLDEYGQPVDLLAAVPLGPSPHGQIIAAVAGYAPDD
jgi:hypothetical protein